MFNNHIFSFATCNETGNSDVQKKDRYCMEHKAPKWRTGIWVQQK